MRTRRYTRPLVRLLCFGVLSLIAASQAAAQPSSNSRVNVVVNGTVNAAARLGNTLYIGGSFSRIAPSSNALGSLVAVNPTTGQVIPGRFPLVVGGEILAMIPDGSGGYYIGGGFDRVGPERQPNLRRLDAAGNLVAGFFGTPGNLVRAMVLAGGHLWVGGDFLSVGSQSRQRLAALDPVTGNTRAFATDANNQVLALAVSGTRLFVGGTFTQIAGQPRNRLAAFDVTTGALLPWNPGADNQVTSIAADATTVYVGGSFGTVGGVGRARVAAIDASTGATITAFAPPAMTNTATKIVLSGTTLYAGGSLQIAGATPRSNAAAFDSATGALRPWNPGPLGASVTALAVSGSQVYLGGGLLYQTGQPRTGVVAVDGITGALSSWNPDLIRNANVLEVAADGSIIVAGGMNATGGVPRFNLAAIDLVSGAILPWASGTSAGVFAIGAIEVDGQKIVVAGGSFSMVNGQPRGRLAAFNEDGDLDDWNPGADSTVNTVVFANGQAYIGGLFGTVAGEPRARLASFSLDGGELTPWAPAVTAGADPASVLALAAGDGVIYAGGTFTAINGAPRTSLAAIDASTGTATAFNASLPIPTTVNALARLDSTLYVGDQNVGLRALNAASGAPTGQALPTISAPAPVRALAVTGNTLYVGGGMFTIGGVTRRGLGGIDLSQTPAATTTWAPDAGYNVTALYAFPDIVVAVGNFQRLNPVGAAGLGVWERTSGVPSPPLPFQAGTIDNLASLQWTAPALGPAATGYTLEVGSTPTSGNDVLTMPLGNVTSLNASAPTGTYYVRVRATNASGQSDPTPTIGIEVGCTAPPGPVPWFGVDVEGSNVSLAWDRPSGNVARYLLEVGSASGRSDILTLPIAVPTTHLDVAAVPPGAYFLRMKAANSCGTGAASSETSIVVGAAPRTPGSPRDLRVTVSGSNVTLSWTEPPGSPTGYVLEAGTVSGLADLVRVVLGPATTFSTSGVPPGTYYVRVRSFNAAGVEPGEGAVVVVR